MLIKPDFTWLPTGSKCRITPGSWVSQTTFGPWGSRVAFIASVPKGSWRSKPDQVVCLRSWQTWGTRGSYVPWISPGTSYS